MARFIQLPNSKDLINLELIINIYRTAKNVHFLGEHRRFSEKFETVEEAEEYRESLTSLTYMR